VHSKSSYNESIHTESVHTSPGGIATLDGPKGHWLLGSLPEFRAGMLSFLERCRKEFGPTVAFRFGPLRIILICEPALVEEVLVSQNRNFRKHFGVRRLKPVVGNGLLRSEGAFWLRQRRLIQPAFSRELSAVFAEIVTRQTLRLADEWTAQPQRDLYRDMTTLALQVAAEALLGVEVGDDVATISEALQEIHANTEQRIPRPIDWPMWIPSPLNLRLRRAMSRLNNVLDRLIQDRRGKGTDGRDALARMLCLRDEEGKGMSDQQLRDEAMTLLLAGHDTTANALTWSWYLLAQHPQVADKLCHEAASVFGDRQPSADDVGKLRYCSDIFNESMRLYPPVFLFGREAIRDCRIGDVAVRKGTTIFISQWLLHRDERFFENPLEFLPERWADDFEKKLTPYAYVPFGGGPRICIGKELALLEGALVLAILGSRFAIRLQQPESIHPWPTITLRPAGSVDACVSARSVAEPAT
jgi:cytochrome P450